MVDVAGAAAGQATAELPPEQDNLVTPVPPVTLVPPVADRRVRLESRSELDGPTDPEEPAVPSVADSTDPTSPLQATAPLTMDSPRTNVMPLIIRGAQLLFPKEALERDGATARTQ